MFYRFSERIPKMLRALVIFLLIIGFVAEARFHGINPYQRLLSKCVIYLLNEYVQQLLRGERRGLGGGGGARDVQALVNQGVPRANFRGEKKKRKFCGFYLADYWHRERIIQFNSNGQLLWVNMKHSTQLRRIVETFFFICCYCQMFIFWLCFCNFLLSLGSLSSLSH